MSLELAKAFINDTRMCDRSQYTDDFTTTFPDGTSLPVDAICGAVQAIVAAGPDFSFNVENWSEEGSAVSADAQVTATMTNDLSHPQFGDIGATGKKAVLGREHFTMTFKDGKVASMVVISDSPSGPPEVIKQWTS